MASGKQQRGKQNWYMVEQWSGPKLVVNQVNVY